MNQFYATLALCLSISLIFPFYFWKKSGSGAPFGAPNWVTLSRNVLVAIIVSLISSGLTEHTQIAIFTLAIGFLILDGVDGYLARKMKLCTDFGARFDMESDAFFILVLSTSIVVVYDLPVWILLIGLMRYFYVGLQFFFPILKTPVKDRYSRKVICVVQIISLIIPFASFIDQSIWIPLLMLSLTLLVFSFGRDIKDQIAGN